VPTYLQQKWSHLSTPCRLPRATCDPTSQALQEAALPCSLPHSLPEALAQTVLEGHRGERVFEPWVVLRAERDVAHHGRSRQRSGGVARCGGRRHGGKVGLGLGGVGIADGVACRQDFQLAMTLIWKNVTHGPEMMVAPHRQARVRGEGVICRYLARLLHPVYDGEAADPVAVTEIDTWSDAAQGKNSEKDFLSHLKSLNSRLAPPRQWIVGEGVSLADVVNWALIKSSPFKKENSLLANVENWCRRCESLVEFKLASRVASQLKRR